jgi:hypothetical protein
MTEWPHSHAHDPRLTEGSPLQPHELETYGLIANVFVRCYDCRGAGCEAYSRELHGDIALCEGEDDWLYGEMQAGRIKAGHTSVEELRELVFARRRALWEAGV